MINQTGFSPHLLEVVREPERREVPWLDSSAFIVENPMGLGIFGSERATVQSFSGSVSPRASLEI